MKLEQTWFTRVNRMVESTDKIVLKPIGVVHTNASDNQIKEEHREVEATVEIFPEFAEALDGLDGYSHLFILSYLHKLRPEQIGPLKVKPKRAVKRGFKLEELPTLGVFCPGFSDSPEPHRTHSCTTAQKTRRETFCCRNRPV